MSNPINTYLVHPFYILALCISNVAFGEVNATSKQLQDSAIAQAEIMAQAFKARRFDILYEMLPSRLVTSIGSQKEYEAMLTSSLGNNGQIQNVNIGPVLSTATYKDEAFATISSQIHLSVEGHDAVINSYIIGVSDIDGKHWDFVNGSSNMVMQIRQYSQTLADKLTFPIVTMKTLGITYKRMHSGWEPSNIAITNAKTTDSNQQIAIRPQILHEVNQGGVPICNPQVLRVGQSWRVYFSSYYYGDNNNNGIYCFVNTSGEWKGRRFPASLYGTRVLDSVCVINKDITCYLSSGLGDNAIALSIIDKDKISTLPILFSGERPMYPSAINAGRSGVWFAYRDFKNQGLMFAYPDTYSGNNLTYNRTIVDKNNDTGWMCRAAKSPVTDSIGIVYTAKTIDGNEVRYAHGDPHGGWNIERVDKSNARFPAVAFSPNGQVGCVYEKGIGLQYAQKKGRWITEQVTDLPASYCDICYDIHNNPIIVFYYSDRVKGKFVTKLYLALKHNDNWRSISLDNNTDRENIYATGTHPSVAIAPNGDIAIAYLESYKKDRESKSRVKAIILSKAEINNLRESQ